MSVPSSISVLVVLPIFSVVFAAVAVGIHSFLRPFLSAERLSEHHEVAGFLMGVVGVLYSVVLGFLVGTVWTSFSTAQQTSDLEAGYVGDAFNYAGQLRDPTARGGVQRLLAQYAIEVRDNWFAGHRPDSDPSSAILRRAVQATVTIPAAAKSAPVTDVLEGGTIRAALLDTLRSIGDARRLRLVQSKSRLPAGMLEALLLGAAMVIAFTFFFGVRRYVKQMIMTGLLAGSIGLFFGLVVVLSTPYSGPIQISRDAWTFVIESNHLADYAR
jgi:Protein of unknown function (DUF4239)